MVILNGVSFPYLFDQGNPPVLDMKLKSSTFMFKILRLDPSIKYWYIEFASRPSLELLPDVIPPYILTELRNNNIKLILANIHEAFHAVVDPIYRIAIDKLKIPEENIILVSESADVLKEIKIAAQQYNRKEIKAIWVRIFEGSMRQYGMARPNSNTTLEFKKYDKKFLNFNRRWRLQRPLFVALMAARDMLDKGHVSLAASDCGTTWASIWDSLIHYHSLPYNQSYPELTALLEQNKDKILNLPEMYLDTTELITNRPFPEPATDKYYSSTYFSVVSETNYYTSIGNFEPGRFFSEKIFKPIYEKHPFVLISPPKSLELLRSLGYRTFGQYINEDYDNEPNDFKRIMMILDEVNRLSNLNEDELNSFLEYVRPICEHNYQCLLSKDMSTDFFNWLN